MKYNRYQIDYAAWVIGLPDDGSQGLQGAKRQAASKLYAAALDYRTFASSNPNSQGSGRLMAEAGRLSAIAGGVQ
jgi:hypothetical protein